MKEREVSVFCINRTQDVERRLKIESQARAVGLELDFVEAVLGKELTYEEAIARGYNRKRRTSTHPDLELNEIACFLSHRKCIEQFLATESPYSLILEDDAGFDQSLVRVIDGFISKCQGWELVKLESRDKKVKGPQLGTPTEEHICYGSLDASKGAAGVFYTRSGATKLLRSMDDFIGAIDTHYETLWTVGARIVGIYPGVVWEREEETSVVSTGRRSLPKKGLSSRVRFRGRRAFHSIGKRVFVSFLPQMVKFK